MKIELHDVKVSDLVDGYADNQEGGVVGYHGQLNIRPKYQREFIYSLIEAMYERYSAYSRRCAAIIKRPKSPDSPGDVSGDRP